MAKEINLEVQKRKQTGKESVKKLRRNGIIPGIVYGAGEPPVPIEIDLRSLIKVLHAGHGEHALINLNIGKSTSEKVLIREVQKDPVKEHIIHVDFQHVSLTETIDIKIPIHLEGLPSGVKNQGGILQQILRELEISCLPTDIPEGLTVDVSALNIGDSIHVRDIKLEKVEILSNLDETIASVVPPAKEEEVAAPAAVEGVVAEAGAEPAEPEVISEKKAEERAAERELRKGEKGKEEGAAPAKGAAPVKGAQPAKGAPAKGEKPGGEKPKGDKK